MNGNETHINPSRLLGSITSNSNSVFSSPDRCYRCPTNISFAHRFGDEYLNSAKNEMRGLLNATKADFILPKTFAKFLRLHSPVCHGRTSNTTQAYARAPSDNLNKFSFYKSSFMAYSFYSFLLCYFLSSRFSSSFYLGRDSSRF